MQFYHCPTERHYNFYQRMAMNVQENVGGSVSMGGIIVSKIKEEQRLIVKTIRFVNE